jgi:hypothetical protein
LTGDAVGPFVYDDAQRLKSITQTFAYAANGNMTYNSAVGTYAYPAATA